MKLFTTFVLFFCLITGRSNAQDIKLIKATSQHWAGGVCCRYGTNYNFVIQTKLNNLIPDTVWINDAFYPLKFSDTNDLRNTIKYDNVTHLYTLSFTAAEFHDDAPRQFQNQNNEQQDSTSIKNVPKKIFTGAAFISYQYKGKQCSFVIKEFTKLKNLSYP